MATFYFQGGCKLLNCNSEVLAKNGNFSFSGEGREGKLLNCNSEVLAENDNFSLGGGVVKPLNRKSKVLAENGLGGGDVLG